MKYIIYRPGRGEGSKKTEICQVCSKIKNLCQTCILDLQYGLPSQIRDAVLSTSELSSTVSNVLTNTNNISNANMEYNTQKYYYYGV